MTDTVLVVCTWLHLTALIVWVGHMFSALLLFSPLANKYVKKSDYGDFTAEYRRRDQPVSLSCIGVFIITGIFLTLLNEQYQGFGDVFANSWSVVLFVKHLLVLAMIGLGVYQGTRVMPRLAEAGRKLAKKDDPETASSVARLTGVRETVTRALCGLAVAVLLLTAIGEVL